MSAGFLFSDNQRIFKIVLNVSQRSVEPEEACKGGCSISNEDWIQDPVSYDNREGGKIDRRL